jgi:hypothetical protein
MDAPRPPPRLRRPGRGPDPVQANGAPRNRSGLLAPCKLRRSARPPAARRIAKPPTGSIAPHDRRYLLLSDGEITKRDRDGELAGCIAFQSAGQGEIPFNYENTYGDIDGICAAVRREASSQREAVCGTPHNQTGAA